MKRVDIIEILEPFATTKVHNPNRSHKATTTRVISIKAIDLARLKNLYDQLILAELEEAYGPEIGKDFLDM